MVLLLVRQPWLPLYKLRQRSSTFYVKASLSRLANFDTQDVRKQIKHGSLNNLQTDSIVSIFSEFLDEKLKAIQDVTISKSTYEKNIYLHKIDLAQLKNDIQLHQKNETAQALVAHEQLVKDLHLGRQKIREKLAQLRSEMRLEMSLEKGRMRDAMMSYQLKYQDLNSKIDSEASDGKAALGKLRHDIFYSLTGFFFTSCAALLGYLRFYM